ncbi:hypothetical protein COCMIDRAFT_89564 [Bipolaris oryzae ATCC 44560]|uniref:Uncharacterized protein n=1 Tax=Bipolaris oryzae ATCC 44560 TaxID=930090 RepID=W6ZCQ7_COCMI|nr:uncharacterized protein COCMIDRAFT_89564 [Bipolaris oryzae ATCC 44560]EUC47598.1 hypothetical protein COCMIDRAFT_89564 [Bipolaris oryzae ATCC 44560]
MKEKVGNILQPSVDCAEIMAILEPCWHIFNFVLEHELRPKIQALIPWRTPRSSPPVLVHILEGPVEASGAAAYPCWVSHQLRRSSHKYNHCDYSIRLFLGHFLRCLGEVNAKIEWFAVDAKPLLLFHWYSNPLQLKVRHSVFSITTRSGEEYIADFTIEQFGYPSTMWFMEKKEYVENCTTGQKMRQPCEDEVASAMKGEIEMTRKVEVVRELCRELDFRRWRRWDENARVTWLEERVQEALKRRREGGGASCIDSECDG